MNLSKYLLNIKFTFIGLNVLIIIGSVFSFIYGMWEFQDKFVLSGSFIGGHLAQLSLLFLLFALLGIYSVLRNDRSALILYASIALCSLFIRNFMSGLASFHGYGWSSHDTGNIFWGFFEWFELFTLLLSSFLVITDKK